MLARLKYSSLFAGSFSDEQKKFYNIEDRNNFPAATLDLKVKDFIYSSLKTKKLEHLSFCTQCNIYG